MLHLGRSKKLVLLGVIMLLVLACGLPGQNSEPEPQPMTTVEEIPPEPTIIEEPTATPTWSPKFLYHVEVDEAKFDSVGISPNGETFTVAGFPFINFYNLDNGDLIQSVDFESGAENMVFSPDGSILGASFGHGQVLILNPEDGSLIEEMVVRGNEARIDIAPDGQMIATTKRGNVVTFWNAADYSQIQEVELPTSEWTTYAIFSPTGNHLAASRFNCDVNIVDLNSFEVLETLNRGEFGTCQNHGLDYSPDGAFLAGVEVKVEQTNSVRVWKADDYQVHVDLPIPQRANDVHFSPDGKMLAAAIHSQTSTSPKSNLVMIWSVPDFELLYQVELRGNEAVSNNITNIRFTSDSTRLVVARWNGVAEVWQIVP